jgi:hypothetical protein
MRRAGRAVLLGMLLVNATGATWVTINAYQRYADHSTWAMLRWIYAYAYLLAGPTVLSLYLVIGRRFDLRYALAPSMLSTMAWLIVLQLIEGR